MFSDEQREKISRAHIRYHWYAPKKRERYAVDMKPFMDAVYASGIPSLSALAERCGVSRQFLSAVARGSSRMPSYLAVKIKELTGWPAENW